MIKDVFLVSIRNLKPMSQVVRFMELSCPGYLPGFKNTGLQFCNKQHSHQRYADDAH